MSAGVEAAERVQEAPAIATAGLSKRFRGGQLAVDALDLSVPQGAVFGFLGSVCGPLGFTLVVHATGSYELAFTLAAAQLALFGLVTLAWRRPAPAGD